MAAPMELSALLIPLLFTAAACGGLRRRVDIYAALTDGAAEGLKVVIRILPNLVALLAAIYMFRASGALAVGSELMDTYGADSTIGRTAAVMLGCTETTFYTVAVYFGAAGIRRTRYTIPAALTADLAGFLSAAWCTRLFFGG